MLSPRIPIDRRDILRDGQSQYLGVFFAFWGRCARAFERGKNEKMANLTAIISKMVSRSITFQFGL